MIHITTAATATATSAVTGNDDVGVSRFGVALECGLGQSGLALLDRDDVKRSGAMLGTQHLRLGRAASELRIGPT